MSAPQTTMTDAQRPACGVSGAPDAHTLRVETSNSDMHASVAAAADGELHAMRAAGDARASMVERALRGASHARSTAQSTARDASRALFRIDPGWPFVITGLGLIIAGTLIPAQRDLHELRNSLEEHRAMYEHSERRLAAYDALTTSIEQKDVQLVERLAASQLNRMPADERPLVMLPSMNATVGQWIDDSEPLVLPATAPYPDTLLARLATGPRRLWILASGVFLIFVGLVFGPSAALPRRRTAVDTDASTQHAAATRETHAVVSEVTRGTLVACAVTTLDRDASHAEHCDPTLTSASSVSSVSSVSSPLSTESDGIVAAVTSTELAEEVVAEEVVAEEVEAEEVVAEEVLAEEVVAEEVASVDIRAESVALPSEQELDSDAAWPNAFDTSLDTLSLFHGIESSKWIDTSDVGSTIVSRRIESGDGAFDDGRNDRS